MDRLTLEEVNKELDKLSNDKQYWENRLEQIVGLTLPKSTNIENERVDGGDRIDKLLKYTELKEELGIDNTLQYINDKIYSLNKWVEGELKRLNKYGETKESVVYLKEHKTIIDKYTGKTRKLKWKEIAKEMHYSERAVRYFYEEAVKDRENDTRRDD